MICTFAVAASADEAKVTEIYSGSTANTGWADVAEIWTTNWGGTLDPAFITEGGYISVYVTGTDIWQIRVALNGAKWTELDWHVEEAQRTAGTLTDLGSDNYVVTFTYDELVAAYGTADFKGTLGAVYLSSNSGGSLTITKVTYTAPAGTTEETPEETPEQTPAGTVTKIYSGDTAYTGWADVAEIWTTNWGGTLDPAFITEGGYISVYFTGTDIWQIRVALNGAKWTELDWHVEDAKRTAGTLTDLGNGSYVVTFTYDELVAAYGTADFANTLGAVYLSSNSGGSLTITEVTYTAAAAETPEEPEVPETTETPEVPKTTETPEVPETSETPETTETPEATEAPETTAPTAKPVKDKVTTVSGSVTVDSGWQEAVCIFTTNWDGTLDPSFIEKEGYVTVNISAAGELWSAHVVLQNGTDNSWHQIDKKVETFTVNSDGSYTVTFSYDELVAIYGSSDFSDLGSFRIYVNSNTGASVTVNSVTYTVPGSSPRTGDESMMVLTMALMLMAVCAMAYMVTTKKRA